MDTAPAQGSKEHARLAKENGKTDGASNTLSTLWRRTLIRDWNTKDICRDISKITFAATDPRMDGFNTWGCKRELYEVLFYVQQELDKCSTYGDIEQDYLKKHDQELILRALGKR